MEKKGGISFALMMVMNPILILFFQNCSITTKPSAFSDPHKISSKMSSSLISPR